MRHLLAHLHDPLAARHADLIDGRRSASPPRRALFAIPAVSRSAADGAAAGDGAPIGVLLCASRVGIVRAIFVGSPCAEMCMYMTRGDSPST